MSPQSFFYVTKLVLLDCAGGAGSSAGAALDAGISVDYVLAISLRDRAYGTFAGAASAANAGIGDNVCHDRILLFHDGKHVSRGSMLKISVLLFYTITPNYSRGKYRRGCSKLGAWGAPFILHVQFLCQIFVAHAVQVRNPFAKQRVQL